MVEVGQHLKGRDFTRIGSWSTEELKTVLDLADELKELQRRREPHELLPGRTVGLIFQKPSTRTRVSFEVGISTARRPRRSTSRPATSSSAAARRSGTRRPSLERYLDAIMIRTFAQEDVEELAEHADIPVINGLTDYSHPCQALADLMTIRERLGRLSGVRLAYLGDGNNVCVSLMVGAARFGMRFVAATPEGYEPDADAVTAARRAAVQMGGTVELVRDPQEAARGADVALHRRLDEHGPGGGAPSGGARDLAGVPDRRRRSSRWPRPTRSSSTACRRTTARRSPRRCSTGRSRPSGTRPRTGCTPRRRCWR